MPNGKIPRTLTKLQGKAVLAPVRGGTGSEHAGVILETSDGETLTLVRLGGNPFADEETRNLSGRNLKVEGYRIGNEFRYVSATDIE